jgi:aspartyl-tRNA(Asn)/glutamyl-tRNA(Gln) amidotransferase subunit A
MNISTSTDAEALAYLDATDLADAFRRRTLSPVEVALALLARIQALDGQVNAVVHVERTYTLSMAAASEARYAAGHPLSPLDGVPVTIKDLSAVAGWPLRRGSLALDAHAPSSIDTPCVERLREAGLVFLAKTATPEAGCKVVTRSQVHGVTSNPYDLSRTPGGSSGGAAAALALGFGPLAVGSDGAGSIRIPACYTNVFGMKPSFGRVPAFPPDVDMPHSVVGPMARTVVDAALMLDVMSRPEPRDPFSWPIPFSIPDDLADPDLRGLKVAVSARMGCRAPLIDPEVDALVAQAGPLLADAGASVEDASPVWSVDPLEPFEVFWATACAATVDGFAPSKQAQLDPLLRAVAVKGRSTTLAAYQQAVQQRLAISVVATEFFRRFNVLVGPVMPVPAFTVERDVPEGFDSADWSWCPYTYVWNMTGQPAASVPIGFSAQGLPVGVQIVGRKGAEGDVLRAAAAIERRRPLRMRRPAATSIELSNSGRNS